MQDKKWYKTNAAVITFLVLFFPFGLYLMWRYSSWSIKNKQVVTVLLSIYFVLFMIIGAVSAPPADPEPGKKTDDVTTPAPKEEKPVVKEKPKATFESSIVATGTPNPATFTATVLLKNTSTVSGKPTCFVTASDVSNTYKGFDTFPLDKELSPGEEHIFNADLVITKQGSDFVTRWLVECNPA